MSCEFCGGSVSAIVSGTAALFAFIIIPLFQILGALLESIINGLISLKRKVI